MLIGGREYSALGAGVEHVRVRGLAIFLLIVLSVHQLRQQEVTPVPIFRFWRKALR